MPIPRHVMIDLETMGVTPDSAIVAIGAIVFDPRYAILDEDNRFYIELDWRNQHRLVDPSTVQWWSSQPGLARKALKGKEPLERALEKLAGWLPDDCRVWGNGATFDIAMLENAYNDLLMDVPWKFWNVRDCRTVVDMFESSRGGLRVGMGQADHNAVNDAIRQAKCIMRMWRHLVGEK